MTDLTRATAMAEVAKRLLDTRLLHGMAPALTANAWRVEVSKAGTSEEEWMVCTVDMDADDAGRAANFGHSVLECVAPVGDEQECDHVRRTLEVLPDILRLVADIGITDPGSPKSMRALDILDYIRAGREREPLIDEDEAAAQP